MFSTSVVEYIPCVHKEDIMCTSREYHEYIGTCSPRMFSTSRGIMMHVGDTMSRVGHVQYIGVP